MKARSLAAMLVGALALLALPATAAPPIDAFGQLPTIGDIALSPDGTRWAAIVGGASTMGLPPLGPPRV